MVIVANDIGIPSVYPCAVLVTRSVESVNVTGPLVPARLESVYAYSWYAIDPDAISLEVLSPQST